MGKARLEAFSDGVIAIIITIMVLEMKVPHGDDLAALRPVIPVFLSYVLSFIYLGIYWNNHHHLFQAMRHINGYILWANLHLLFWLSLAVRGFSKSEVLAIYSPNLPEYAIAFHAVETNGGIITTVNPFYTAFLD